MSITTPSPDVNSAGPRRGLRARLGSFVRPFLAVELASVEILVTSMLFSFEANIPAWQHPAYWLRHVEMLAIVSAVALAVLAWPRRSEIGAIWQATAAGKSWAVPLAVNLGVFAALTAATVTLTRAAADAAAQAAAGPPWGLLWLYSIPLLATGLSLMWLAAPVPFWRAIADRLKLEAGLAALVGVVLLVLGGFARSGWDRLAALTLDLVARVLSLYETMVVVDAGRQSITVGRFTVIIDQSCSGYEGVALVSTFLALFLWAFRDTLRFPRAFLLLPIGIAAILLLNVLRIAAQVSLGAHLSPDMAANGFHSQAGWMAFLAVTIGIMLIAPRSPFFSHAARTARLEADRAAALAKVDGDRLMLGLLAPFMALMAGAILTAASAPFDVALYGLKVIAAGIALWVLRDVWAPLLTRPGVLPVGAGIAVGLMWVVTDIGVNPAVGSWLTGVPVGVGAIWLAVRGFGGVIIVPLVEELAFRGLLYRWLISRRFEQIDPGRFSLVALVVSSALFGIMHQRWLAGAMAGCVFALLMIRSGRIGDAIQGHVAANATIFAWAILMRQWTLM